MGTNKTHKENAIWELQKYAAYCLKKILETTHHKTTAVRLPASHLTNHSSKTNKLDTDTVYNLKNLFGAIDDRDGW